MSGAIRDLAGVQFLVTGGAGFIGSHLVEELLERGARVRVLDDFSTGSHSRLRTQAEVEILEGDVRSQAACTEACKGVRYLFHEAALGSVPRSLEDPAGSLAVNAQGTVNLLAAAVEAGVERVVYASSSSVYGDSQLLPKREGEEGEPLSPYALSKRHAEQTARVFARCYGLPSVGLRYFNVYGPRQDPEGPYAAVIPRFFRARLAGEAPVVFGDGEQSRDFTFVGDAVRANLLALEASLADGRAVNVASGRRTTINELDRLIAELSGGGPAAVHAEPRAGDVRHSTADLELAGRQLGYAPETDLASGLAASKKYYESLLGATPAA